MRSMTLLTKNVCVSSKLAQFANREYFILISFSAIFFFNNIICFGCQFLVIVSIRAQVEMKAFVFHYFLLYRILFCLYVIECLRFMSVYWILAYVFHYFSIVFTVLQFVVNYYGQFCGLVCLNSALFSIQFLSSYFLFSLTIQFVVVCVEI